MKRMLLWGVSIAMAASLVACGGRSEESAVSVAEAAGKVIEESAVEEPVTEEIVTEESAAEEQSNEVNEESSIKDTQNKKIFTVNFGDEKKEDFYFESVQDDFLGFCRYIFIHDGKAYLFFQIAYPEDNYREEYRLAIVDLETNEYKDVAVKSELEELCKNYTDDFEGYEENGDSYFEVVPDETGAHEWLKYFGDGNEIAFVYFKNFGVDKDGNVFALVRFSHTYWGNGQLNDESGDYELLKWSPDGEFLLPRDIFGEDKVAEKLADAEVLYDPYGEGYDASRYYERNGDEHYALIRSIADINEKQFVGVIDDREGVNDVFRLGIFTAVE